MSIFFFLNQIIIIITFHDKTENVKSVVKINLVKTEVIVVKYQEI